MPQPDRDAFCLDNKIKKEDGKLTFLMSYHDVKQPLYPPGWQTAQREGAFSSFAWNCCILHGPVASGGKESLIK